MFAVAITIAVLCALATALLAVPVMLVIDAERVEALKAGWHIRWLFGLVDIRLPRDRPSPPERSDSTGSPKPDRNRRRKARIALAVLGTRGLIHRVMRTSLDVLRHVTLEEFRLQTAFGFDNPADTGVVYGVLAPWLVLAERRGLNVECRPMFLESGLRGALRATIHLRPLAVLGTLLAFLMSRPVRRAVRSAWRVRK
jgi:hypothetical protein